MCGASTTRRAVTLWPDADGLSVARGGPGGPSVGELKVRAEVRPDSLLLPAYYGLRTRPRAPLM